MRDRYLETEIRSRLPERVDMADRFEEQLLLAPGQQLNIRFRLLGILPLFFFLAQAIHYWRFGGFGNMLWMCNIGNLALAIGILLDQRNMIRLAAIWTIPGLFIWFWYVVVKGEVFFSSTLAHVGGLIVAMVALSRVRVDRWAWLYAFGWYLALQIAARLVTLPELNVNAAHSVYAGWDQTFNGYGKFWLVMTALVAFGLWLLGLVLGKLWPAVPNQGYRIEEVSD
jgi:hypothetical protein